MKFRILSLLVFLCFAFAKAQVGIGTTTPQATLDIPATDPLTPGPTEGILIPRVDEHPTGATAAQDGMMVFVTGNGTPAKGFYYWDNTTTSWVLISGVTGGGGTLDEAYDFGGSGAGNTITATDGAVIINGEDGLEVTGTLGSGDAIAASGAGSRMIFNPNKGAFRAGNIDGTQWDDANVGFLSIALGSNTIASGFGATALGGSTEASGATSTAFGSFSEASGNSATAFGNQTEASATTATAFGNNTLASGVVATAFGNNTSATNTYTTAFGNNTEASGINSTSFGSGTEASGQNSTAWGFSTEASGAESTSFGLLTVSSGDQATSFGRDNISSGDQATSFGRNNSATGFSSVVFGTNNTASGSRSTSFGSGNTVSGDLSVAFGFSNTASGSTSSSFGAGNIVSGAQSVAFGRDNSVTEVDAVAFGRDNVASGRRSAVFGYGNEAPSFAEITVGSYATPYTVGNPITFFGADRLFSIGNGPDAANRSNALTIYKNGLMNINDAYNMPLTDGTANQVMTTDGAGNVTFQDAGASGGTLDEAYDFGGAGAGNTITATDGAVTINGEDGVLVTGTFGSGETITPSGAGTRMFFNPRKAAFRAGRAFGTEWDNANVGNYSVAFSRAARASGDYSFAMGFDSGATAIGSFAFGDSSVASGNFSVAMGAAVEASGNSSIAIGGSNEASGDNTTVFGLENFSQSYGETTMGIFSSVSTPLSATSFNMNDRLVSIGNGTDISNRGNALTIYKSGLMNINDAYNMPLTDGTANQVMATDGAGNVTFQDAVAGTDDQQIDVLNLNGTNLEISLQDDGIPTQTLDLAPLQDGVGTDNQQIDVLNLNGTNLEISLQNDGVATQILDLSPLTVIEINDLTDGKTDTNNSSVYLGIGAGNNDNDGLNFNTGIGANALTSNTSGFQNTAVGSSALLLNTTGNNNVALGQVALLDNTTGSENIAVGRNALGNNVDGNQNIGIGGQALFNSTTTSDNIAIGFQALSSSTSGRNMAIGSSAGLNLTSGNQNIGIGFRAQSSLTQGNNNVAIGDQAMNSINSTTNSSNNVVLGNDAMSNLTEGSNNVAIGTSALFGNGNGDPNFANNNVAIGYQAGLNTEGNANVFIGYQAGLLNPFSNNRLFIENSTGDENNALIYGEFDNDILRTNGELQIGNPAGTGYAFPITDGTTGQVMTTDGAGNVTFQNAGATGGTLDQAYDFGGAGAGRNITVDNGAVQISGNAGGTTATTPAQLILTETQANDFSRLRFTNSVETTNTWTIAARTDNDATVSRMNFNHNGAGDLFQLWGDGFVEVNGIQEIDGRLGININNPGQALILPNTADNTLGGTLARAWTTYSDGRVKSDQQVLENALSLLLETSPKTYFHHDSSFENGNLEVSNNGVKTVGFIAQELYEILPEAVYKPADDTTELWSVDYDKVIPLAVKAIQELKAEKDALSLQVNKLKDQVQAYASLEERISALENQSTSNLQKKSPNAQLITDE